MNKLEERIKHNKISRQYVSGEKLPGITFRHNSKVEIKIENKEKFVGWIVGVEYGEDEPVYLIEREDRKPDIEVKESCILLIFDPHEEK